MFLWRGHPYDNHDILDKSFRSVHHNDKKLNQFWRYIYSDNIPTQNQCAVFVSSFGISISQSCFNWYSVIDFPEYIQKNQLKKKYLKWILYNKKSERPQGSLSEYYLLYVINANFFLHS